MSCIDLPGDRQRYGPTPMPWQEGGCLLPEQQAALEDMFCLNARVRYRDSNKNKESRRQLAVTGPKVMKFEECAQEAKRLIRSNYAKGIY